MGGVAARPGPRPLGGGGGGGSLDPPRRSPAPALAVAGTYHNLAVLYQSQGNQAQANEMASKAHNIYLNVPDLITLARSN